MMNLFQAFKNLFLLGLSLNNFIYNIFFKYCSNLISFYIIIIAFGFCYAQNISHEDTLIIHPISFSTESPEGWVAQYKTNIDFPDESWSWRKIFMIQTLKCDSLTKADKYDCGEWDYIWDALLYVPQGDSTEIFKLGSFVTPYGKRLNMGEEKGWQWVYDISDYAPLLIGKRELHIGNNQELLDLKFHFIGGTPYRESIAVENIYPLGSNYDGHYGYTHTYKDLSKDLVLTEKEIELNPNASGYSIKAIISGHGHEGPKNCCEWTSKSHSYIINGFKEFTWNVWTDCGNNPLYPQGGTWPYDRAGWCPGTKVDEYIFELTHKVDAGQNIKINYEIEKMVDSLESKGIYRMSHQLFSFGPPNYERNLEVVDIINPSSKDIYSRVNPTLSHPTVVVKNIGSKNIRRIKFVYGLVKGKHSIHRWKGDLSFLDQIEIKLPINDWSGIEKNKRFFVSAKTLNGREDENNVDNILFSTVQIPEIFPNQFNFNLKTNNLGRAKENKYEISDYNGNIYYSDYNLIDSTSYNIPIYLEPGLYRFIFSDSAENGIDRLWWHQKDSVGISGKIEFHDSNNNLIKRFSPDFGQEVRMDFIIGPLP